MSREQMRKLLSEPTNEELLQAENEQLHRIAEQATERGMKAEAELARLREENKQLRRAYESDAEAIEQAAENARLREEQSNAYQAERDRARGVETSQGYEIARLRERNEELTKRNCARVYDDNARLREELANFKADHPCCNDDGLSKDAWEERWR